MGGLAEETCVPCRGGVPPMGNDEIEGLLPEVPGWRVTEEGGVPRLKRAYRFPDFAEALRFTDRVGALAEEAGHHPSLLTEWGRVTVAWWTHAIGGLHRNDFVMAARTDGAYGELAGDDGPDS